MDKADRELGSKHGGSTHSKTITFQDHVDKIKDDFHEGNIGIMDNEVEERRPMMDEGRGPLVRTRSNNVQKCVFFMVVMTLALGVIIVAVSSTTQNELTNYIHRNDGNQYPSLGLSGYESYNWDDIEKSAIGSTVNLYIAPSLVASWCQYYLAPLVWEEFSIKLNVVVYSGSTPGIVDLVQSEMQNSNGPKSVDMIWMNGLNYYRARNGLDKNRVAVKSGVGNILYGPWANKVPSADNFDWKSTAISLDFGHVNGGFEMPFWQANFVLVYRADKISTPPKTFQEMADMMQPGGVLNGRFTYAKPSQSNYEASAFIRHFLYEQCYTKSGSTSCVGPKGYAQYMSSYDQQLYDTNVKYAFQQLRRFEGDGRSNLWNRTYCATQDECVRHYKFGETYAHISYSAPQAGSFCADTTPGKNAAWGDKTSGVQPCTGNKNTTAYVPTTTGAISNTNFMVITDYSPNKLGALVVGNYMGSIQSQFIRRTNSGYNKAWIELYSPTANAILKEGWDVPFQYLRDYVNYPQTPNTQYLRTPYSLPEIDSRYGGKMEADWEICINQRGTALSLSAAACVPSS
eukprot:gene8832-18290_t